MPARNAPSAKDRPTACVAQAAPIATNSTANVKSSGELLFAISWNRGRSSQRPEASTMSSATAAFETASAICERRVVLLRRGEHAREREEGHDREVLEQQHAEREASVRAVELVLLGELAQHDGGRGHRHRAAEQDRDRRREADRPADRGDGGRRAGDLQAAEREHLAPHRDEARQRELEPESEQQEHDAELGERLGGFRRRHPAECVGADAHAHDQEGEDHRQAQAAQPHDDHECRHEEQQDVFEDAVFQVPPPATMLREKGTVPC